MKNIVTVGVYASQNYKVNVVRPEDLEKHIEYNNNFRPGRALFVDGKCVNKGYLTDAQIKHWEEKIKGMKIDNSIPSEKYQ